MKLILSEHISGKIIYQNAYPENFDGKKDIDVLTYDIDQKNYKIKLKEKWFEGIHISFVSIKTEQVETFEFLLNHNHVGFLYCLEGCMACNTEEGEICFNKNQQSITVDLPRKLVFNANGKTKYLYIQLTQAYYQKITNGLFKDRLPGYNQTSISTEIELILQSINNHSYTGQVKRLFLQSKIYELIICYSHKNKEHSNVSLKQEDIDKILLAKILVESDLQNPNSLLELSRKAGINDYKLKKGFKEVTGHTVFGYLAVLRMKKAYEILTTEKKTVNEVAFLVGYKNPQHFTVAFKKQYKILPGSLNKS